MIFKIFFLFIGLGSLMICAHDLIVLNKTKEIILTKMNHSDAVAKLLLTHVSIVLIQVSVPVENGSQ
jgi:hypothetical protein